MPTVLARIAASPEVLPRLEPVQLTLTGKIVAPAPVAGFLSRASLVALGPRRPPRARRLRAPETMQLPSESRILLRAGAIAFR